MNDLVQPAFHLLTKLDHLLRAFIVVLMACGLVVVPAYLFARKRDK